MLPLSGATSSAMMLRTVDLPQPDGPTRQQNSPSAAVNETSSSATKRCASRSTKLLPRRSTTIPLTASRCGGGAPAHEAALDRQEDDVFQHEHDQRESQCPGQHVGHRIAREGAVDHISDAARQAEQLREDDDLPAKR